MKKKQFMSKLAALTMAAAMGLTAVPATALNVMASTTVTSDTEDAVAVGFPTMATVKGWLDTLTARKDSSAFGTTITADTVKQTLNTNLSAGTISATAVTELDDKQDQSTADAFAYHTYEITLTNSTDSKTRTYTAVLTAEKLTDIEAKAILPDYMTEYISANAAIGETSTTLKTKADTAASAFSTKYGVTVTVSAATFTKSDNGTYTITFTAPASTPNVTGTVNFYKDSQVSVENKTNGTSAGRKSLKNAMSLTLQNG